MTRPLFAALAVALFASAPHAPASAGILERACNQSDRKAATRQLCNCIQGAASGALSRRDQRLAATFFKDPHRSQEIRQSDRASHEDFWKRYKAFGQRAKQMCG